MCSSIFIEGTGKQISSPKQFYEHFGFHAFAYPDYKDDVDPECCLCQVMVEDSLNNTGLEWYYDCGEYYVKQVNK